MAEELAPSPPPTPGGSAPTASPSALGGDGEPVSIEDAELLRRFVAGRDVMCPACRYNLRDLKSDRCPECGLPLVMRVGLAEPAWGSYLTSLIGLSVGLGFCALLGVYAVFATLFSGFGPPLRDLLPLLGGVLVCGPAIWWLLQRRARFVAMARDARRGVAVAAWLVGLGFPILFFALIDG